MKRRAAIQNISLLLGTVISEPTRAGIMGHIINTGKRIVPKASEAALIKALADVIIPSTDTPGAAAASVQSFIIRVMSNCYPEKDQKAFYTALANVDSLSNQNFNKTFVKLDSQQQNEVMKQLTNENKPFFLKLRELTIAGYFTSEIGATQALAYLPIPGKFEGCLPMLAGQKTWAL